jgi:hypothetical protein
LLTAFGSPYQSRPRKDHRGVDLISDALRRNGIDEG